MLNDKCFYCTQQFNVFEVSISADVNVLSSLFCFANLRISQFRVANGCIANGCVVNGCSSSLPQIPLLWSAPPQRQFSLHIRVLLQIIDFISKNVTIQALEISVLRIRLIRFGCDLQTQSHANMKHENNQNKPCSSSQLLPICSSEDTANRFDAESSQ